MKPKKESTKRIVIDGFVITPGLDEKFENDPFFLEKDRQAQEVIKKYGLPKELKRDKLSS